MSTAVATNKTQLITLVEFCWCIIITYYYKQLRSPYQSEMCTKVSLFSLILLTGILQRMQFALPCATNETHSLEPANNTSFILWHNNIIIRPMKPGVLHLRQLIVLPQIRDNEEH